MEAVHRRVSLKNIVHPFRWPYGYLAGDDSLSSISVTIAVISISTGFVLRNLPLRS